MADWEEIIRTALPAVAGFYAGHQGQIGPYTQGLMQSQHQIDQVTTQKRHEKQQQDWHSQQIDQQNIDNARQQSALDSQTADRATALQRQQDALDAQVSHQNALEKMQKDQHQAKLVHDYFSNIAHDPSTIDYVQKFGKDAFSVDVPGIGPINLQKALEMGAAPPAEFGLPKTESLVPQPGENGPTYGVKAPGAPVYERPQRSPAESLVAVPGKKGPVYGKKVEGAPVYEKPPAPEKPGKPVRHAYTTDIDDGAGGTKKVRIIEDENGNIISTKEITADLLKPTAPSGGVRIKSITPIP